VISWFQRFDFTFEFNSCRYDVVWCHDYHLMLLPSKLKEEHPNMKVGWFLHTPFPSSEIYRMLPVREELLLSVLSAVGLELHKPVSPVESS
jgi:trehalose-6-phosphate synthase